MAFFLTKPSLHFLLMLLFLSFYSFLTLAYDNQADDATPFTYSERSGKGPKNWGRIDPHWKLCGNGKLQSPIDLTNKRVHVSPLLGKLKRDYKPAPAILSNRGHDIEVTWLGNAGKININRTDYKLIQIHWHTPSEHTINGQRYAMELHAVHKNSKGEAAVIGILYKYGRPDSLLSRLFHKVKSIGKGDRELGIINPGDIKFGSRKYYRYIGSLTTPPCTEGVIWTIVNKVRTVSREQVRTLKHAVHHGFEMNARPTQQLDGRPIWFYSPKTKSNNGGSA